jgi:hypothetical protein
MTPLAYGAFRFLYHRMKLKYLPKKLKISDVFNDPPTNKRRDLSMKD